MREFTLGQPPSTVSQEIKSALTDSPESYQHSYPQSPEVSSSQSSKYDRSLPEHHLPSSLWSWDESVKGKIKRLSINAGIRAWCEADPDFHNWIKTSVANHVASGHDETVCPIPDRWRAEVGDSVTVVSTGCLPGKMNGAGGQELHGVCEGVYHVMAGA